MKKEIHMNIQQATPADKTPVQEFRCPKCMMGGATCSDCDAFNFTNSYCDYHNTYTTGNTWACPAYYDR